MDDTSPGPINTKTGVGVLFGNTFSNPSVSFHLHYWHHFRRNRQLPAFHLFIVGPGYFVSLVVFSLLVITSPTAKTSFWERLIVAFRLFWRCVSWVYVSICTEYGTKLAPSSRRAYYAAFCGRSLCFWALRLASWHLIHQLLFNYPLVFVWITLGPCSSAEFRSYAPSCYWVSMATTGLLHFKIHVANLSYYL